MVRLLKNMLEKSGIKNCATLGNPEEFAANKKTRRRRESRHRRIIFSRVYRVSARPSSAENAKSPAQPL
jgi:hypothetical protein